MAVRHAGRRRRLVLGSERQHRAVQRWQPGHGGADIVNLLMPSAVPAGFEIAATGEDEVVRWLQEQRRFKPSTVSRRLSVVVCFYRTCVIDAILDHSPAAHVRRPPVSAESPTLGLSHLQFEAMLVAARPTTYSLRSWPREREPTLGTA